MVAQYRIDFKNHGGHVFSSHHFESERDEDAIGIAHGQHAPAIGHGFNLWNAGRLVLSHPKQTREGQDH